MKPRYRVTKFTSDGFVMVSEHQVLRCTVKAQITWKNTERVEWKSPEFEKFLVTVEERVCRDRWQLQIPLKPGDKFLLRSRPELYETIEPDFL